MGIIAGQGIRCRAKLVAEIFFGRVEKYYFAVRGDDAYAVAF